MNTLDISWEDSVVSERLRDGSSDSESRDQEDQYRDWRNHGGSLKAGVSF
jgi:hypothetical protein